MKKIFVILLVLLEGIPLFAQSPWVPGKGKGYLQASFTDISGYTNLYLDGSDRFNLAREIADRTFQIYGEYGLHDRVGLEVTLPVKLLSTGSELFSSSFIPAPEQVIEEGDFTALGNIMVGGKYNFFNDKFVLSGSLKAELPTSTFDEQTGLRSGLDAFSLIPGVSIGKGWNKVYGYVSTGFGLRTNDYSHDFRLNAEVGINPVKPLWAAVVIDVLESFRNGDAVEEPGQLQTGLYLNNQEFVVWGFKAQVFVNDHLGISGGLYGALSGNLVARQRSLNLGIFYKW